MCFRLANEVSLDEGRHPLTLRKASYSFPELARGEHGDNPKEKKKSSTGYPRALLFGSSLGSASWRGTAG